MAKVRIVRSTARRRRGDEVVMSEAAAEDWVCRGLATYVSEKAATEKASKKKASEKAATEKAAEDSSDGGRGEGTETADE